ncbi:HD-GYP domain-containing protein [Sphingobium sufflavum]|uniref:HD-GYP domain-containing protein n=1 Tax=Sphingobium sufflavum TaxID=1129547 RepID=UPI0038998E1E
MRKSAKQIVRARTMLKRIRTEDLALGMFLHKMEGSWLSHPFWKSKFLLDDQKQLADIRGSTVEWVMIDVEKGSDIGVAALVGAPLVEEVAEAPEPLAAPSVVRHDSEMGRRAQILGRARQTEDSAPATAPTRVTPYRPLASRMIAPGSRSLNSELTAASEIAQRSRQTMRDLFSQARLGKTMDVAAVEPLVDDIMHSIQRHPHAFNGVVRLMKTSDYLHTHALAVSALMINLALQLGLRQHQVREAGLAGLLMDVGMGHVPQEIYDKQGELTPAEQQIVHSHTTLARDFMEVEGQIPESVVDVCLHHHERFDGSGYPHGLKGQDISLFARMAAICDSYDAMTSRRTHKAGMDPAQVIAIMREDMHRMDPDIFEAFVRAVGIYPVGTLVRLSSDKLAMVLDQNPKNPTLPRVRTFYATKEQEKIEQEDLNLVYRIGKDAIVSRENPADWGFDDWDKMSTDMFRKATGVTIR